MICCDYQVPHLELLQRVFALLESALVVNRATEARLLGLQILRAVAALLVVVDHSILNLIEKAGLSPELTPWASALGNIGVQIFFAISGFIMAYTTRNLFGAGQSLNFLLRRVFRIVPIYWLVTSIYVIRLWLGGDHFSVEEFVTSYLFIPFLDEEGKFRPLYGVGWTLNYEMLFYLVFAVCLALPRRIGIFLIFLTLSSLVAAGFVVKFDPVIFPVLAFYTNPIVLCFLGGVVAYFLSPYFYQLNFASAVSVLLAVGFVSIYSFAKGLIWLEPAVTLLASSVAILVFSRMLFHKWEGRLLVLGTALGDASFSIYLTHSFLLGPASSFWGWLDLPNDTTFVFVGAMLVGSSALGWITYRAVEQPIMKALRPLLPDGRRRAVATSDSR